MNQGSRARIPDFLAEARRRFRREGFALEPEAERFLQQLYFGATERLESAERIEGARLVRLASTNHRRFLGAIIEATQDEHRDRIDRNTIERVLAGLCPLFPFC